MLDFGGGLTITREELIGDKWGKLCVPKKDGELEFHDMGCFNKALLVKQ